MWPKKRGKIVPPSFKVLVKKKPNHIVKQTFIIIIAKYGHMHHL